MDQERFTMICKLFVMMNLWFRKVYKGSKVYVGLLKGSLKNFKGSWKYFKIYKHPKKYKGSFLKVHKGGQKGSWRFKRSKMF